MIQFDNWRIWSDQKILAPQFDHKTCLLAVTGDLPAGWTWEMLVSVGEDMDVLSLAPDGTGAVSALLTAEDDLAAAQSEAESAWRDLFNARNNYRLAVDYGILA